MGRLIVYCDVCGERIVEEDITRGRATQDGGRYLCVKCKPVSPVGTPAVASPAARHSQTVTKAATGRFSTVRNAAPSKTPMIVAGIIGGLCVIALLAFVVGGSRGQEPAGPSQPSPAASTGPTPPKTDGTQVKGDEHAGQRKTVEDIERAFAGRPGDYKGILDLCAKADAGVTAGPLRQRLMEVKLKAEEAQKLAEAEKRVAALLEEIRTISERDDDFLSLDSVKKRFQDAREACAGMPTLNDRITRQEDEYKASYDKRAQQVWEKTREASERLSFEKDDHKGAIRALENFPLQFRQGKWSRLYEEHLKKYEEKLADARNNKAAEPTIWEDYQRGSRLLIQENNYPEGAKVLMDVIRRCNDAELLRKEGVTDEQLAQIAVTGQYNVACAFSLEKDVAKALDFLEASLKAGYCDWEHIDKDKDFDPIRGDERFKTLIKKYRKMFGVKSQPISDEESRDLSLPPGQGGMKVVEVIAGSIAEKAGIKVEDIILEFDKKKLPVEGTYEKFVDAIKSVKDGTEVAILVLREKKKVPLKAKFPK